MYIKWIISRVFCLSIIDVAFLTKIFICTLVMLFTVQLFHQVSIILVSGGDFVDFLRYRVRICCAFFIC